MATYASPSGWSANSLIGEFNAMSQAPLTAADLLTDPSVPNDPALGSRTFMNPYAGTRKAAATASVYAQPDAPAWLAGAVSDLNAEQALRRSAQAEMLNRIFQGATDAEENNVPWLEVLRAAVLQPGVSAGFGSAISDPRTAQADLLIGQAAAEEGRARASALTAAERLRGRIMTESNKATSVPGAFGIWREPSRSQNARRLLPGAEQIASSVMNSAAPYIRPSSGGGMQWGTPSSYTMQSRTSIANPMYQRYAGNNSLYQAQAGGWPSRF